MGKEKDRQMGNLLTLEGGDLLRSVNKVIYANKGKQ